VGEVLDAAFRLYRRHFLAMLAIVAVGSVPATLLIGQLTTYLLSGGAYSSFTVGSSSTTGLQQFLMYIPGAALVIAMLAALTGGEVSFKEAYRRLRRILPRVVGLIALHLLVWLVVYLPSLALSTGVTATGTGAANRLGALSGLALCSSLLSLPYLIVSIRLYIVLPAMIAEDLGPVQAIRRSWYLTRNYWWRTWALSFVLGLLSSVIVILPQAVVLVLLGSVFQLDSTASALLTTGSNIVFATLFAPVELLALGLYYIDQRVRKEGLDLETAITRRYPPVASYAYAPVWHDQYEEYEEHKEYAPGDSASQPFLEPPTWRNPVRRVRADGRGR
jgi:voltage-gated potassium channel Kch